MMAKAKSEGEHKKEQAGEPSTASSRSALTDREDSPDSIDVGREEKGSWTPQEDRELSGLIKVSHLTTTSSTNVHTSIVCRSLAAMLVLLYELHHFRGAPHLRVTRFIGIPFPILSPMWIQTNSCTNA